MLSTAKDYFIFLKLAFKLRALKCIIDNVFMHFVFCKNLTSV